MQNFPELVFLKIQKKVCQFPGMIRLTPNQTRSEFTCTYMQCVRQYATVKLRIRLFIGLVRL